MNRGDALLVFRKEMLDLIRDRRSIFAMIVFPVLIHPVLLFGSARLAEYGESRRREQTLVVVVEGGPEGLRERILSAPKIEPLRARRPEDAVRDGRADLGLLLPDDLGGSLDSVPEAVLYFDGSRDLSREGLERVEGAIEEWRRGVRRARLESLAAGGLVEMAPALEVNVASEERMTGGKLGKIVPILIVFLLLNGASFAAVDLFAGERERKTMETLLTSLADRSSIVAGKFFAVVVSAVTATTLFLGSSFVFTRIGWIGDPALRESWAVPLASALVVFLVTLPLALLVSAVLVLISSHARTYREAQTLLLPSLFLAAVPAAASLAPGVRLESFAALVPIANVALAVRETLLGNFPIFFLGLVVASNSAAAFFVLKAARGYLAGERSVLAESKAEPEAPAASGPRAREATVFYAVLLLVLYYLGSYVQTKSLLPGLLLTLWGFLLLPTLLFARRYRLDFRRDLSIRPPSLSHVLGGVLVAPGALLAATLLFRLQSRFLPVPGDLMESFEKLLGGGEWPAWLVFLAVAISPAICEEVLFRGLLLGQHRKAMPPARAVLLGGLLFGLFHLSIYRILPTALLGTVAGALVFRTASIVPAMALHAAYNGLSIAAAGGGGKWAGIEAVSADWATLAVASTAAGVLLLRRRRRWGGEV
ncbi:MAG: CPBP family intramembrane metalloprotease [Candidatus Latescibacterota bacterium]|nr:MAG: CPBP family intramembrane metalloprotease [Candidatus Latescibacterota bacterium]